MKKYLLIISILCFESASFAQSTEDSIKQVINNMFAGMKASDTMKVRSCFSETAFMQTFRRDKEGKLSISTESVSDFCKSISATPAGTLDERITYDDIKIDENLASVWTPFKLYIRDVFYSCGANSFQMARLNGQWKIQYIIDTRKKDNCPE